VYIRHLSIDHVYASVCQSVLRDSTERTAAKNVDVLRQPSAIQSTDRVLVLLAFEEITALSVSFASPTSVLVPREY